MRDEYPESEFGKAARENFNRLRDEGYKVADWIDWNDHRQYILSAALFYACFKYVGSFEFVVSKDELSEFKEKSGSDRFRVTIVTEDDGSVSVSFIPETETDEEE